VPPFYNGSLYGAVQLADGSWVAYGMRGNAYRAGRRCAELDQVDGAGTDLDVRPRQAADGSLLLVGQGGIVLRSRRRRRQVQHRARRATAPR
jgi:hypothetical protein